MHASLNNYWCYFQTPQQHCSHRCNKACNSPRFTVGIKPLSLWTRMAFVTMPTSVLLWVSSNTLISLYCDRIERGLVASRGGARAGRAAVCKWDATSTRHTANTRTYGRCARIKMPSKCIVLGKISTNKLHRMFTQSKTCSDKRKTSEESKRKY